MLGDNSWSIHIATELRITKSRSFWSRSACMQDTVKSRFTSWSCKKSTCQTDSNASQASESWQQTPHIYVLFLRTCRHICIWCNIIYIWLYDYICTHSCISLYKWIVDLFIPLSIAFYVLSVCVCVHGREDMRMCFWYNFRNFPFHQLDPSLFHPPCVVCYSKWWLEWWSMSRKGHRECPLSIPLSSAWHLIHSHTASDEPGWTWTAKSRSPSTKMWTDNSPGVSIAT